MKRLFVSVCILMASILVLVGCAQPATSPASPVPTASAAAASATPSTAPITAPTSTTTPVQAPAKPIELTFAHQGASLEWNTVHAVSPWIKQVEEATKGRVKITLYPGQTLCKAVDSWVAVKSGIADMSWIMAANSPGLFPLTDVKGLPAMNWTSALQSSVIAYQLFQKFPSIQKEWYEAKVLLVNTSSPMMIGTTKKQVKTLEDMKGFKLRNTAGTSNQWFQAMGASPILIAAPDMYMAIQKGVVDGAAVNWDLIVSMRLWELLNYYTETPSWSSASFVCMNLNRWNSLPPDIQDQIMSVGGLAGSKFFGSNFTPDKPTAVDVMKKAGINPNIYTLPAEEADRWTNLGKTVWTQWVKDNTAAGRSEAQQILDGMLQMIKDYKG